MGETARITANPCRITRCRMFVRIISSLFYHYYRRRYRYRHHHTSAFAYLVASSLSLSRIHAFCLHFFLSLPSSFLSLAFSFQSIFSSSSRYLAVIFKICFITSFPVFLSFSITHNILSLSHSFVLCFLFLSVSRARVHSFVSYEKDSKPNT